MTNRRVWLGLGLAGLVGAGLLAPGRARATTEQPGYDVLDRLGDGVVVRRYGARLAARVAMAADDGQSRAFRRLAGFIFGGNRGEGGAPQKIAMTAPVEVSPSGGTMRFFMPARFTAETLPAPSDAAVAIETLPAQTLAVLTYSGSGRGEAGERAQARLKAAIEGGAWRAIRPPMFFFYDAPWVPTPLRRNEVVIEVEPVAAAK